MIWSASGSSRARVSSLNGITCPRLPSTTNSPVHASHALFAAERRCGTARNRQRREERPTHLSTPPIRCLRRSVDAERRATANGEKSDQLTCPRLPFAVCGGASMRNGAQPPTARRATNSPVHASHSLFAAERRCGTARNRQRREERPTHLSTPPIRCLRRSVDAERRATAN